jgi:pentatricopeptide repeat protein
MQTVTALRVELLFFTGALIIYATTKRARSLSCKAGKSLSPPTAAALIPEWGFQTKAPSTLPAARRDISNSSVASDVSAAASVSDVVTYNILMKSHAKSGKVDECFSLYSRMRELGLTPSTITFGIMLDGCINGGKSERATEVFDSMAEMGCPMNAVLCTTLIKGFAREGKVDEVMRIYRQMLADQNSQPDLITFSMVIKANCDAGHMEVALDLFETMLEKGLTPDEVIFNSLLSGCSNRSNVPLARQIYQDMVACGVSPSSLTFSILVRLYSSCKHFPDAIELLRCAPKTYNVDIEPRLYAYLLQSCVRARQGKFALEVYNLMADCSTPSLELHSSLLTACMRLNLFDTGVELLEAIAAKRGCIHAKDAQSMLEVLEKKHKSQLAVKCNAAMRSLGVEAGVRCF